ncbi:hypothetical protein BST65_17595 [Bradyrhizobium canariense]|nr:hypothetical protein BST65_17595 [Bradyrhizobium canariense]OSI29662.1 hypothetical protein BST66_25105 [Bradyrhizobium canariense]OSI46493.1 hypothetical protein BSZ20_10700 [Bradyrhizobium canariense]OSI53934.1 hypothetical protein BST67_08110 [Bradyrhizobium canariense]OSI56882.1 hypothetical protein BSZ15_15600 [Bradyrhizobium canariense]
MLFQSTSEILKQVGLDRFSGPQFAAEMTIIMNVIAVIGRCRRVAIAASATEQDTIDWALGFHPIAMHVRAHIQREFLEAATAQWAYGDEPSDEDLETVAKTLDSIVKDLSQGSMHLTLGSVGRWNLPSFPIAGSPIGPYWKNSVLTFFNLNHGG